MISNLSVVAVVKMSPCRWQTDGHVEIKKYSALSRIYNMIPITIFTSQVHVTWEEDPCPARRVGRARSRNAGGFHLVEKLHSCHAFDSRLKDEGTVSLGRCVAIYSETKTEGSGNKSFRPLHLDLHIRELETELLLAAKRASLAYGSTSSASERSASQNSSDLSWK